jgi:hypothetical protein
MARRAGRGGRVRRREAPCPGIEDPVTGGGVDIEVPGRLAADDGPVVFAPEQDEALNVARDLLRRRDASDGDTPPSSRLRGPRPMGGMAREELARRRRLSRE